MAYRPTEKTLARKAAVRDGLLAAALACLARDGFNGLTIAAVAQQALCCADILAGAFQRIDASAVTVIPSQAQPLQLPSRDAHAAPRSAGRRGQVSQPADAQTLP